MNPEHFEVLQVEKGGGGERGCWPGPDPGECVRGFRRMWLLQRHLEGEWSGRKKGLHHRARAKTASGGEGDQKTQEP